jgi:hypothetical protein
MQECTHARMREWARFMAFTVRVDRVSMPLS